MIIPFFLFSRVIGTGQTEDLFKQSEEVRKNLGEDATKAIPNQKDKERKKLLDARRKTTHI
jgi:hypothetical protein